MSALVLAACFGRAGGVEFTLENAGATTLDSVVVFTTGHAYELGDVPAGGRRTVLVKAADESHIELEHGQGKRRRLVVETYFEPGYRGTVQAQVRADTVLAVESVF